MHSRCFFVDFPALTAVTAIQRYQRHLQSSLLAPQEICPLLLMKTCTGSHLVCGSTRSIQFNSIVEKIVEKDTLNAEITMLYQFYDKKASPV